LSNKTSLVVVSHGLGLKLSTYANSEFMFENEFDESNSMGEAYRMIRIQHFVSMLGMVGCIKH
jgi:hypothetical protein